jgi:hypothetical protein
MLPLLRRHFDQQRYLHCLSASADGGVFGRVVSQGMERDRHRESC